MKKSLKYYPISESDPHCNRLIKDAVANGLEGEVDELIDQVFEYVEPVRTMIETGIKSTLG